MYQCASRSSLLQRPAMCQPSPAALLVGRTARRQRTLFEQHSNQHSNLASLCHSETAILCVVRISFRLFPWCLCANEDEAQHGSSCNDFPRISAAQVLQCNAPVLPCPAKPDVERISCHETHRYAPQLLKLPANDVILTTRGRASRSL